MSHATLSSPDMFVGRLFDPQTPLKEGLIAVEVTGTDYKLHLAYQGQPATGPQGRVQGRIYANAKKVDRVKAGGRFIEPSVGRPRRIQGRVIAADIAANTITVQITVPMICQLDDLQKADQFPIGGLVRCNIERGARFEPAE